MPLSRLRLRLSAAFALAFAIGLVVLNLSLFLLIRRDAEHQLTHHLQESATGFADALAREYAEAPRAGLDQAARETIHEWPATSTAFIVYDSLGAVVARYGSAEVLAATPSSWRARGATTIDRSIGADGDVRLVVDQRTGSMASPFRVVAIGTLQPTVEHVKSLGWWMLASAPLVVLLSLAGGYGLARQALRPIATLERAVGSLEPGTLGQRLPVAEHPDELDHLALQFNDLLGRLEQAQSRNRRFVQRAAHQLKTPLTVVLGEADLCLGNPEDEETRRHGMRRVRTAAHQMRRRVDELLLLAEAQMGERVPLDDLVELDGLALECTDLMRGRAAQTAHCLALGDILAVTVRGSDRLLREALLELLENACRHGSPPDVRVSVSASDSTALVEVASGGSPLPSTLIEAEAGDDGAHLGLTIVRWIAGQHGGRLWYEHRDGVNVFGLSVATEGNGAASPA
ncbi:MAG TPA: HAMP domain-containing sensor histidine kinase [Gemmatimonadales bacterium]|jgi:signal transduction histidine kinase